MLEAARVLRHPPALAIDHYSLGAVLQPRTRILTWNFLPKDCSRAVASTTASSAGAPTPQKTLLAAWYRPLNSSLAAWSSTTPCSAAELVRGPPQGM